MKVISVIRRPVPPPPSFVVELSVEEIRWVRAVSGGLSSEAQTELGNTVSDGLYNKTYNLCRNELGIDYWGDSGMLTANFLEGRK